MTESAIYRGKVFHQRFKPTTHKFDYDIYLFWLKLELGLVTYSHHWTCNVESETIYICK